MISLEIKLKTTEEVNALIEESLKMCGFSHDEDDKNNLVSWALDYMVDSHQEIGFLELEDWITTVGIMAPNVILPATAYKIDGLKQDVIEMICKSLKRKKTNATKREIHELAFEADQLNENYEIINDMKHAVNYVVKIFCRNGWQTPEGFEDAFSFYKRKVTPLIPTKNTNNTLH